MRQGAVGARRLAIWSLIFSPNLNRNRSENGEGEDYDYDWD